MIVAECTPAPRRPCKTSPTGAMSALAMRRWGRPSWLSTIERERIAPTPSPRRRPWRSAMHLAVCRGDNQAPPRSASRSRTARSIRSTHRCASALISCCQIRNTRQPPLRSRRKLHKSRCRLRSIFARQYGGSLCFQAGNLQPWKKSPSTNTATFAPRNARSGLPATERGCFRYRNPRALTSLRIASSGLVSVLRIRDIA